MMTKTKYFLSLTLASAFLIAGCGADETPSLSSKPSVSASASDTPSADATPVQDGEKDKEGDTPKKGEIKEIDGREVEVYDGLTPMPSDDILSPDEAAAFLIAENNRVREENKKSDVSEVNISADLRDKAIGIYTAYSEAMNKGDFKKACTYVYPGESKTAEDCVAHYESISDQLDVSFNFDDANSAQNTTTRDIIFQQKTVPENGETIPRLTFVEKNGTLLLSVPVS